MERLTFKAGGFNAFSSRGLSTYGGTQSDGSVTYIGGVADKLAEYEDLEEQGRLLKLPCAVGDNVYTLNHLPNGKTVIEENATDIFMYALRMLEGRFGKTMFLTMEEAEAALNKIGGGTSGKECGKDKKI